MTDPTRTTTCAITGRSVLINDCLRSGELRPSLLHFIQKRHPGLKTEDWISRAALPDLKAAYVEAALSEEIGELGELER
ncbi:MAG TPA: hypothetical protein P5016_18870, partial [Verrucomicrobiales bacterium]|nr:hypothetical protein [Verrucomicrobiales bacterium]